MTVLSNFPLTTKSPVVGVTVNLGRGSAGGQSVKKLLCLGNRVGGTKADSSISLIGTGDEADTFFGAGSSLARMCRKALDEGLGTQVYGGVIPTVAGTAARADVTFAAGPASIACSYEITINGFTVTTSIPATTTAAAAAGLVVAAIQASDNYSQMPILATDFGGGVMRLTAKEPNVESTWAVTNIWQDDTGLAGSTLTATLNTAAVAGAGALDMTNVLAAAASDRYDYIAIRCSDATNVGRLETHLDTYATALNNKRGQGIAGSMDIPANQITLATTVNAYRVEVVGLEQFQQAHYENVAKIAARRLYEESSDAGVAYMNYPVQNIMPPHLSTSYMTDTEREAALNAGVTPVMVYNGESTIPRMITSHSRTAGGAPDYNCLDTSNVTIADKCADDIVADFSTRWCIRTGVAFKIMDDPTSGQVPSFVVTPNLVIRALWGWMDEWYSQLLIVNPESPVDYKATVAASRIGNRINAQLDLPTMGGAFQFDVAFYQKSG